MVTYARKNHQGWNVTMRSNLISHPSIQAIQVLTDEDIVLFINLYNPSDNSVAPLLTTIDLPSNAMIMITGDFNLHHSDWAKEGTVTQSKAQPVVDWMRANDFNLLNRPGEITWFREPSNPNFRKQSSVLDLTWASSNALPHISSWGVREDLHIGSDHLPITWKVTVNNTSVKPTLPKYRTHDELQEPWAYKFRELLDKKWTFPDYLSSEEEFNDTVKAFHEALTETSNAVLIPKTINPRPSFWFNNICRSAVRKVRNARRLHKLQPSQTDLATNFHKETTSFKLSIRKSKRLGAMELANKVTHANIWRMNDWYRGKRRMFSPILTDKEGNTAVHPKGKTEMMHESFFSPPKPLQGDFSWKGTNENTRTFVPVTV